MKALAREYAVCELRHETNRGYGAALKTGFLWVAQNAQPADAVVTLDADNTQDPDYIPALLNKLEEGYDVVTASYTMEGGHASGLPYGRYMMSTIVNSLFRLVVSLPGVETYTNGLRAFRASFIRRANETYHDAMIEESGFPGGTEFFIKVVGLGARASEVPFQLHYENRGGASKIRFIRTIARYLALLARAPGFQ